MITGAIKMNWSTRFRICVPPYKAVTFACHAPAHRSLVQIQAPNTRFNEKYLRPSI